MILCVIIAQSTHISEVILIPFLKDVGLINMFLSNIDFEINNLYKIPDMDYFEKDLDLGYTYCSTTHFFMLYLYSYDLLCKFGHYYYFNFY